MGPHKLLKTGKLLVLIAIAAAALGMTVVSMADDAQDADRASPKKSVSLQEVVVTAQKRSENLLDVPVPVTAVSSDVLVEQNEVRFQDYFSNFPGLSFSSGDRGEIFPTIRGLGTGAYQSPTVGITIDDVPYGTTTTELSAPDIDPSDLERVEVLRGPQGTLYGASSIGGLIKYVTVEPSLKELTGRLEASTSDVYNRAELGYSIRGAANLPITDTLAMRVSGYTRQEPGYIDNVARHVNGINEGHVSGGHLAALWSPTDTFSFTLSALIQHAVAGGDADVNVNAPDFAGTPQVYPPGGKFGDLQQSDLAGGYNKLDEVFAATLKARFSGVDFTSITGYSYFRHKANLDLTGFGYPVQNFGADATPVLNEESFIHKVSQEFRFSSSVGSHLDWLLGAFYTHEGTSPNYYYPVISSSSLAVLGSFGVFRTPSLYQEYAAFADATVHLTDRLDVQIGGRESHDEVNAAVDTYTGQIASAFFGVDPYRHRIEGATANPFTYLITPEFKVSPDLMIYFRAASGFRPGGGNSAIAAAEGHSDAYAPDKTENYELGVKGRTPGHSVSFDLSVYRINWKGMQTTVFDQKTGESFIVNAAEARSQGVEMSTEVRPASGLTIGAWVTFSDASLTQNFPPTSFLVGMPGDVLPYAPRFSGNLSLQQDFPIVGDWTGFLGGRLSYIGMRLGDFTYVGTTGRGMLPAYAETDLRAGVKCDSWRVTAFLNNVTDRRGVTFNENGGIPPYSVLYIQPRTVGIIVSKSF